MTFPDQHQDIKLPADTRAIACFIRPDVECRLYHGYQTAVCCEGMYRTFDTFRTHMNSHKGTFPNSEQRSIYKLWKKSFSLTKGPFSFNFLLKPDSNLTPVI